MDAPGLRASIVPHEIIFTHTSIHIEAGESLDPQAVLANVFVRDRGGAWRFMRRGCRAVWSPSRPLTPGRYVLRVGEPGPAGEDREARLHEIPFFVTDSRARVPGTMRVQSMVRLKVGHLGTERVSPLHRPGGKFVELMKTTHRVTGKPRLLAFDQAGQRVDAGRLFTEIFLRRRKKYGKLHPSLHDQVLKGTLDDRYLVAVWLADLMPPFIPQEDLRRDGTPQARIAHESRVAEARQALGRQLEDVGVPQIVLSSTAPVAFASVTKRQIRDIEGLETVWRIFGFDPRCRDDIADSVEAARSNVAHNSGTTGQGVNVAVWESGPEDTSLLEIVSSWSAEETGPLFPLPIPTTQHAVLVHGMIKHKGGGGHAPGCSLYSADYEGFSPYVVVLDLPYANGYEALDWAVKTKGCSVVNQSFHFLDEPGMAVPSLSDVYKDYLALTYGTLFVHAAGNLGDGDVAADETEYVNHKGYNGLTVASHGDADFEISGTSAFANPNSPMGDREIPEISANGTGIKLDGYDGYDTAPSGTSFASPAVAGAAALIQEADTDLQKLPEGCRAILLAAARRNLEDPTWWDDHIDGRDIKCGSGALDAGRGVCIAERRRPPGALGTSHGWDVQDISAGDLDAEGFSACEYKVRQDSVPLFFASRVKVALAWNSRATLDEMETLLDWDLDLSILDPNGTEVGYSGSFDNSYEIAEFDCWPLTTYTVRIRLAPSDKNPVTAPVEPTRFGIAWTVRSTLRWVNRRIALWPLFKHLEREPLRVCEWWR